MSEDKNIEHLFDVPYSLTQNSRDPGRLCKSRAAFLLHKGRLVVSRPKAKGLPDDNPFKSGYLFGLHDIRSEESRIPSRSLCTH